MPVKVYTSCDEEGVKLILNFNQMIDFEKDNKKFFPRYIQKTHD